MNKNRGVIYIVLVALQLTMGVWWIYFLTTETDAHAQFERQKFANDRLHALFLLQAKPSINVNPGSIMSQSFPHLIFTRTPSGVKVVVDPAILQATEEKARSTRKMFLYEGFFFLCLLVAGSTILILSWRSEARFVQARELFLAGATHEFKTPLASLRLYTETLRREGLRGSDKARIQHRMVEDIQRLENLVDEILAMSADDTFSPGPRVVMDLVKLSQGVIQDLHGVFEDNGAKISFQFENSHLSLGHEVVYTLALRNLLVNSIRHNDYPVNIEVLLVRRGNWHLLTVRDDGRGIPKRLHDKVFDCFYSGDTDGRPGGGTGVGLYLVRRNVTNLGGKITIDDSQDKGCTFYVMLPAHQGGTG